MKVSLHDLLEFADRGRERKVGTSEAMTILRYLDAKERKSKPDKKSDQITIPKFTVKHIMGFFFVFGIPIALGYIIIILKLLAIANNTAAGIFH